MDIALTILLWEAVVIVSLWTIIGIGVVIDVVLSS